MRRFIPRVFACLMGLSLMAAFSVSAEYEREVAFIKQEWMRIALQVPAPRQAAAYAELADRARALANRHPGSDEARQLASLVRGAHASRVNGSRHA